MTPRRRPALAAAGKKVQVTLLPVQGGARTVRAGGWMGSPTGGERTGFWSGKTLRGGLGAVSLGLPALPAGETLAAAFPLGEQFALVAESGAVYRLAGGVLTAGSGGSFDGVPAHVYAETEDGAVLFLSDGMRVYSLSAEGLAAESAVPPFVCAAFYGERLWTAMRQNGGTVQYSAPFALRDFAKERGRGGEIAFAAEEGDVTAMCVWEDALYLFRGGRVQKLTALGDERDFRLREAFVSADACPATVAAGDRIYWLGEDGVHAYDGSVHVLGEAGRFAGAAMQGARGAFAGGVYYLQARARLFGKEEDCIAAFAGEECCLVPRSVRGLASCRGQALLVYGGQACEPQVCGGGQAEGRAGAQRRGQFPDGFARRAYVSEQFSAGSYACLQRVRVHARGRFLLTAESERGSRTVEVRGGRAAYPVGIAGECFRLRLSAEEEGEVYSLQAELEIRA